MKKKPLFLLFFVFALSSCATLSPSDKRQIRELKGYGITLNNSGEFETPKSAAIAGLLNLFPGFGNFYLGQTGVGVINFLFWPISVVWGVPQAIIDTDVYNQQHLVDYYMYDPYGKKELARRKNNLDFEDDFTEEIPLSSLQKTRPIPDWVVYCDKEDKDAYYYVGRASAKTEKEARYLSRRDAHDQAVKENFGVLVSANIQTYLSEKRDSVIEESSESTDKTLLIGFRKIDEYVQIKGDKVTYWMYFKYSKKAIEEEKARQKKLQ